jgi:transcriptional regulator
VEVSGLAKDTYHHLKEDKKGKVLTVLKRLFQKKSFQEVTVKEIVEELDIARGSFYQYFEDLEDAYFTVLDSEVTDIHMLFMYILHKKKGNFEATLLEYGEQLSKIL